MSGNGNRTTEELRDRTRRMLMATAEASLRIQGRSGEHTAEELRDEAARIERDMEAERSREELASQQRERARRRETRRRLRLELQQRQREREEHRHREEQRQREWDEQWQRDIQWQREEQRQRDEQGVQEREIPRRQADTEMQQATVPLSRRGIAPARPPLRLGFLGFQRERLLNRDGRPGGD